MPEGKVVDILESIKNRGWKCFELNSGCPIETNMDILESVKQRKIIQYDIKKFLSNNQNSVTI